MADGPLDERNLSEGRKVHLALKLPARNQVSVSVCLRLDGCKIRPGHEGGAWLQSHPSRQSQSASGELLGLKYGCCRNGPLGEKKKNPTKKNDFISGSRTGGAFDPPLLPPSIAPLNNGCSLEARAMSRCKPTLLQKKMSQMHHRRPARTLRRLVLGGASSFVGAKLEGIPLKVSQRRCDKNACRTLLRHPSNPFPLATLVSV